MNDQSWKIEADEAGTRLDKWLAGRLGSRSKAFEAIAKGRVFVDRVEQQPLEAGRKLAPGNIVRVWHDRPGSASQRVFTNRIVSGLNCVYEDDALLVINKPAGKLTVPLPAHPEEDSLYEQVSEYLKHHTKSRPQVVHRLDRDTSGLVVFAKTRLARENLKHQFMSQKPVRIYYAIVHGTPKPSSGVWQDWLLWDDEELIQTRATSRDRNAVEAKCSYRVIESLEAASLIEVSLTTGKQNQIRAQAAMHGHQVAGDRQYLTPAAPAIKFTRQALHAHRLELKHPTTGRLMKFEAPLPIDLEKLLVKLRTKVNTGPKESGPAGYRVAPKSAAQDRGRRVDKNKRSNVRKGR